jgi:hypothetical protein
MRRSMTMALLAATALGSVLGPALARSGDVGYGVHHYARFHHGHPRVVVIPRYPETFGAGSCYYTDTNYPAIYNDCSPFGRQFGHEAAYGMDIGPGYPQVFNGTPTFNGTDCHYSDTNYPAFYNDCRPVRPW